MKSESHGAKVLVDPLWLKKKVNKIGNTGENLVLSSLLDYITNMATLDSTKNSMQTSSDLDNVTTCDKHELIYNTCIRRPTKFQLLQSRFMNPNHRPSMKKQREVGKLICKEKPCTFRASASSPVKKLDLSKYQNLKKESDSLPFHNDKVLCKKSNGKSRVKSILKNFIAAEENGNKDNPSSSRMTNVKSNSPKILTRNTVISVLKERFEQNSTICSVREVKPSFLPKNNPKGKPHPQKNINKAEVKELQIPTMDLKYLPTPTYEHANLVEQAILIHVIKNSTVHGPVAWMTCETEDGKSDNYRTEPCKNKQTKKGVNEQITKNYTNQQTATNVEAFSGAFVGNDKGQATESMCQEDLDNNDYSAFESNPIYDKNNLFSRNTSVTGHEIEHEIMSGHNMEKPEMLNDTLANSLTEKKCEAQKITVNHLNATCQEENLLNNYIDTQNNNPICYEQRKNREISEDKRHSENDDNDNFKKRKQDTKTNGLSMKHAEKNESVPNKSNPEVKHAEETEEKLTNWRAHSISKEKNDIMYEKEAEKHTVNDNEHIFDMNNIIYKEVSEDSQESYSNCNNENKEKEDIGNELILTKTTSERKYEKEMIEQGGLLHHCKSERNVKNEDPDTHTQNENKQTIDNNNIQYNGDAKKHSEEEQLSKNTMHCLSKSKGYVKNENHIKHTVNVKESSPIKTNTKYPAQSEENPVEENSDILSKCENTARNEEEEVKHQAKHKGHTTHNVAEKTKIHSFKQEKSTSQIHNKQHGVGNSKKRSPENELNMLEGKTKQKSGTSSESMNSVSQENDVFPMIIPKFNTQRKEVNQYKPNDIKKQLDIKQEGTVKDSNDQIGSGFPRLVDDEIKFRKKCSTSGGKYGINYAAADCFPNEGALEDIPSLCSLEREGTITTEPSVHHDVAKCITLASRFKNLCVPETSSMEIHHVSFSEDKKNHEKCNSKSSTKSSKHHNPQKPEKESSRQKQSKSTEEVNQKGGGENTKLFGNQVHPKYQNPSSIAPSSQEEPLASPTHRKYCTTAQSSKYRVESYQDTKISSEQSFKPLVIRASDTFTQ